MCGIVGAAASRDVVPILVEGLKRLEYRGYDSAGVCVIDDAHTLKRSRALGKVAVLEEQINSGMTGHIGIAHTRWATHGEPSEVNAHPHVCNETVAVVHNGIIENHEELKAAQLKQGYRFTSETDTEVVVHQIPSHKRRTGFTKCCAGCCGTFRWRLCFRCGQQTGTGKNYRRA